MDPITFNIIRHKLWSVLEEMGTTIKRTSISPIIWDANDFQTTLLLADGSISCMGAYGATHSVCHHYVIKEVIKRCSENPGIYENDQFIMNDPYLGGSPHPADVCIVSPLFYKGELIFWMATSAHLIDIGASKSGNTRDIYEEGWVLSPAKIVERGKIRKDVFEMLINMTRFPEVELDLQAMIAANNVAKDRLNDLLKKYDITAVKKVAQELIKFSEKKFKQKLKKMADGIYRHTDYLDHDGFENKVYKIVLTMTKKGETLKFDYTGTSEQAPGIANCCAAGSLGAIMSLLGTVISYDIPFNHGLLNAIQSVFPEGSVINAVRPAALSGGSTEASWSVRACAQTCILKMLACSEQFEEDVMGCWMNATAALGIGGENQYGKSFFYPIMDHLGGGCGARTYKDGLGSSGTLTGTMTFPNVETHEEFAPFLILFRREARDTGGAGKFRGGLALEEAFILHNVDEVYAQVKSHGVIIPNTVGTFGAYPGSINVYYNIKDSDVHNQFEKGNIPIHFQEIHGEIEQIPAKITGYPIKKEDCIYYFVQGGGGYGDPLERDPDLVLQDYLNDYVSYEQAKDTYGVWIEKRSNTVNYVQTKKLRQKMLSERIK